MDRVVLPPELTERLDLLVVRLGGVLQGECGKALAALRLNEQQYTMLQVVASQGPVSRSDAVVRAGLDPKTAGTVVAALVRRGAVGISRHPEDRRRRLYAITDEGRELLEAATTRVRAARAKALAGLPEHERAPFLATIHRFVARDGQNDGTDAEGGAR